MADYKDYIVRYDIIADVTKAAEGLQSIANIASTIGKPMEKLKTAITQVSSSVYQLKQNSQMTFAPKIDVGAFNNQLRAMVTQVRSAAAEMHTAIFQALSGNAAGTKAVEKGISSALSGTRSVAAIKKDIEAYNRELDKLLGTPKKNKKGDTIRNRDGAIQMTKNALAKGNAQVQQQMQERLLKLESQKRMFQNLIQQRKAELAVAEKLEKETAAQQTKAAKAQSKIATAPTSKATSTPQPAKLTNVTPAVIREWKKAFGDARSKALTVNIRGNATGANGALTVIEQIQSSLRALQSQATFNINPILNTEGFAAAEAQLKRLAGLSAAVVVPFTPKDTKAQTGKPSSLVSALTKDEKTKLTNAQKQIKAWNEKIAPIQSRLDANRAIPEDQRTPAIKGQITRDTKTLAAYQANRAEQENIVRTLQGKTTAVAQAAAKAAKPLTLDIVGNLSKINVTAKAPVVPIVGEITKIQNKVTEAIPVNVKISGEQIAASLKTITPTPILDVKVHLIPDGVQQQLQAFSGQTKPIVKTTPKVAAPATPVATPHPVYTSPTFTAAEEKQLNTLAAKAGTLSTAQEKAAKAMASAKAKLDKSGGSSRAFDRYMATQREYGGIRKEYLDIQKQLKPLMFKQFQSTAQRALTDEEIVKGIGAQNIVNQLATKKRLNAAQKTQLAEASQTLAALRAPVTPPAIPVTTTPTPATTQPTKVKKAAAKNTIAATVDTKNVISQIQNIPRQTIPVAIKLMWERGAVGRQEQIKKITANIPPVTLNFETATAIAKLEEFVAKVRAASPQNIKLTATGVATNAAPTTTVPPTQKAPTTVATPAKDKKTTAVAPKKPAVVDTTKGLTQTKLPSVALKLDTTAAVVALEEFVAKVRAASPQNIKLTATGVPPAGTQQNATAPATNPVSPVAPIVPPATDGTTQKGQKQSGHTGHQPLTPRQYRDQLGAHLAKGGMLPPNYATQIADQQRRRAWHLDQMKRDAMAAFAQKTPYELAEEERLRKLAPTTAGTGKNKVAWGSTAPAAHTAPNGYKWVRANDLTSYLNNEQQQQLAKLRGDESNARGNVARIQSQIARSTGKSNARLEAARTQYAAIQKQMEPYLKQMAQLEEMKKPLLSLKKPNKTQRSALARIESSQAALQTQIDQYRQAQAPFANAIQHETALMARYGTMSSNALSAATQQHSSAQAAVSRYTDGWKLAQTNPKGKPSESNIQKAARLQAQAQNAMLPFAQSKEQLNMLTKHRRYFRQAVATTGIMPTPGMEAPQMLKYLQGVSTQMQKASVAVPWTLQSQINKLEGDVAKANGVGQPTQSRGTGMVPMRTGQPKPFFDRSRRWAYPFTGQTSFGVRTPMAVDMAKGMGVMFAIGGAMSAIGSSFSQAMEYQNTMRTTQAILQNGTDSYSQNSFKNMEATVRNVGVKTKFSAPEVASAARFLAMAGYDIDAINAAIRPIADLALIGDSDLGETADKMTNIMTTFQIAPDRMREAANIMATTATRSNTDLMMLAESAKYGGGVANMYGRNDSNLFADTMALFGVMGNAGIQASSAGTALRMMYQNLFKPNKNQKAVLDMMKQSYGITTLKEDGSYRSMSDILIEMAQRIPENQMASIVGNLFRITAQPGAAATLLAAAGGDKGIAQEIGTGIEAMSNKMSSKAGLSSLVSLMLANRNSVSGNISGAIAEEKQNTISGLWAQVTSTFTEGIVQAFENRQGGFEEMLKKLRDYLAKPETIQMMQNLLDLIVEVGKVLAWFVKIWASLYNAAPGLIKFWITFQMGMTQIGTLIAPIISLIGVFDRLKGSIMALAGVSAVGGATMTRNVAGNMIAGTAANAALLVPTPGASKKFAGKIGSKVSSAMATNAILAGELALSGASKSSTLKTLNQGTAQHYKAVQERYYRRYGWARAGAAFRTASKAGLTMASFAPLFGGLKSMAMSLFVGLSKAVGFLLNPISAVTIAAGSLGFAFYKLHQFVNGNTEAQILAQQQMAKLSEEAAQTMVENYKWYQEQMDKFKNPAQPLDSVGKSESQREYESRAENFRSEYADIIKGDLSKNASEKEIRQQVQAFRERVDKNRLYKYAFGEDYDKYMGSALTEDNSSMKYTGTDADGGIAVYNLLFAPKRHAKEVQNREIQAALRTAGVKHPAIQAAHEQIVQLRKQYLGGDLTESQYLDQAYAIRDKVVNPNDPRLKSSTGLTLEEFQNISDPSRYKEYALGQFNVLNSFITGADGTIVAKLNAQQALRDRLVVGGEQYWQAISNVIGDYPIQFKAVSMDEKIVKDIELTLSMLPDGSGRIDFNAVSNTIQSAVGDFQKNIEDFANMTAKVYQSMANAGLVPNTEEGMRGFVWNQVEHSHITKEQAAKYYHDYLPKNSVWKQSGKSLEEFQEFVTNPTGEVVINGKKYSAASQRVAMRRRLTNNAVNSMMETVNKYKPKEAPATSTTTPKSTAAVLPQSNTNQQAYASHYDRSAARPTQVVFNINNLASFDRTTVASSAEERDLMAAMEDRIAGAVYQMFAEASNLWGTKRSGC